MWAHLVIRAWIFGWRPLSHRGYYYRPISILINSQPNASSYWVNDWSRPNKSATRTCSCKWVLHAIGIVTGRVILSGALKVAVSARYVSPLHLQ